MLAIPLLVLAWDADEYKYSRDDEDIDDAAAAADDDDDDEDRANDGMVTWTAVETDDSMSADEPGWGRDCRRISDVRWICCFSRLPRLCERERERVSVCACVCVCVRVCMCVREWEK